MQAKSEKYWNYVKILEEELIPAMGCTEPIALAYAAAKAREVLGVLPTRTQVEVSGNIVKNAKSVVVPNTGGLKGIQAAAAAGIVAGNASKVLEVLTDSTQEDHERIREYQKTHDIRIVSYGGELIFYIAVTVYNESSYAKVVIEHYHTNIVCVEKDGKILFQSGVQSGQSNHIDVADRGALNVKDIVTFADIVDLVDITHVIGRQIEYNSAIAEEGMTHDWGANIGKILVRTYGNDVKVRARALAAAGSDARMGGSEKPVIILSGSGNQGLTASLPVIEYAKELQVSQDKLFRAVALADLITVHQKTDIGRLSAFCGAVCAGCAAGAGIAYLSGGDYDAIAHTVVNALAISSGIVCDGAKASCAAKIASAVDAGIIGWSMYQQGEQFYGGEGIVAKGVDNTIANVGRMASQGMRETDREIIKIMMEN